MENESECEDDNSQAKRFKTSIKEGGNFLLVDEYEETCDHKIVAIKNKRITQMVPMMPALPNLLSLKTLSRFNNLMKHPLVAEGVELYKLIHSTIQPIETKLPVDDGTRSEILKIVMTPLPPDAENETRSESLKIAMTPLTPDAENGTRAESLKIAMTPLPPDAENGTKSSMTNDDDVRNKRKRKRGSVLYQCVYCQHRSGNGGTRYNIKSHMKTCSLKPDDYNVDIDINKGIVSKEVFLSLPLLKPKRI